jgi:hypothetical protein
MFVDYSWKAWAITPENFSLVSARFGEQSGNRNPVSEHDGWKGPDEITLHPQEVTSGDVLASVRLAGEPMAGDQFCSVLQILNAAFPILNEVVQQAFTPRIVVLVLFVARRSAGSFGVEVEYVPVRMTLTPMPE